jgi:hypothetical protein
MRFPERTPELFLLRLIILVFSFSSTLSYAGSPNGTQGLVCRPSQMWFGLALVGQTTTIPAALTNTGSTTIKVSSINPAGSGFSISGVNLPLTLSPGQSVPISVSFSPQAGGHVDATFGFTSTSGVTSNLNVHGTGANPGLLSANPPSIDFGTVTAGTATRSVIVKGTLGRDVISQALATGSGFSVSGPSLPLMLSWGQTATFNVSYTPQSSGAASGSVTILTNVSGASLTIPLTGTGGATAGSLSATAPSLSFGNVQVGSTQMLSESLTNSGGSSVTITQANASTSAFSLRGLGLPLTLTPGQSFTFGVVFAPTTSGSVGGTISVASNASNPQLQIALAGSGNTAVGQLGVNPGALNFGSVVVGQSHSMTATLTATGASVVVSSASAGSSEFAVGGPSLPLTIPPGQSASFSVTFTPQSSGTASAGASFTSNATNSTMQVSLTGSGTPPPQHIVNLSWNPSTSGAVGYNVYRGGASGGPYTEINPTLDPSTTYTDSTVLGGQTYYYVSTALDASGVESGFSNEVKATIPAP